MRNNCPLFTQNWHAAIIANWWAIVNVTSACVLKTFTPVNVLYQDPILFSACYPDDEYLEVGFYLISFTQTKKINIENSMLYFPL